MGVVGLVIRDVKNGASLAEIHGRGGDVRALLIVLVLLSTLMLGGCELIGNIFQAGVWVGVILVLLILGGIAFVAAKLRG